MSIWTELPLPPDVEATAAIVRRIAIQVHREVGPGFRENVYQRCMEIALVDAGCRIVPRARLSVAFRGIQISNAAEADLIVNDHMVVELKARDSVHVTHVAQLTGYLRATGYSLGHLFNFHVARLMKHGYHRVVHPRYLLRGGVPLVGPVVLGSEGLARSAEENEDRP